MDSNYKGLRVIGNFVSIVSAISVGVLFVALANRVSEEGKLLFDWIPDNFYLPFAGLALGLICLAVADIADNIKVDT